MNDTQAGAVVLMEIWNDPAKVANRLGIQLADVELWQTEPWWTPAFNSIEFKNKRGKYPPELWEPWERIKDANKCPECRAILIDGECSHCDISKH